jgi:hypothetical protein
LGADLAAVDHDSRSGDSPAMTWAGWTQTRGVAALLVLAGLSCGDDAASTDGGSSEGGSADAAAGSGAPIAGRGGSGGTGAGDAGVSDAGANLDGGGDAGPVDPLACDDSLDCADQTEDRTVCHPLLLRCMQCVKDEDCDEGHDCIDHECRPYTTCVNSLDCELGEVCDATRERCVACVMDSDCGDDEVCRNDACERVCDSDNDCTPLSKLCDLTAGHCVECVRASDCPEERHCLSGRCAADECKVDFGVCTEDHAAVLTCAEDGSGPMQPVACGAEQACGESEDGASCRDWECTPGAVECADSELVSCSADGLEVVESEDCEDDDKVCAQQACRTQACMPASQFCDGDVLRVCSADGVTSQSLGACLAGQYCDPDAAACATGMCAPSEPACNGAVATTCNATGDGFEAGGDDCAEDDEACVDGSCEAVICTPGELSCSDDGDVQRCSGSGTAQLPEQVCTSAQYCDSGACVAQECTPDAVYCDGVELRRCNAPGNGYEVEDTCDVSQQCDEDEGECVDIPDGGVGGTCTATGCPACPITSGLCCVDGMCGCSLFFLPSQCTKAATDVACACD